MIARLGPISEIDRRGAKTLVIEVGMARNHFSSADNLASWDEIVPGNNESASK